jgi:hypothetical protein
MKTQQDVKLASLYRLSTKHNRAAPQGGKGKTLPARCQAGQAGIAQRAINRFALPCTKLMIKPLPACLRRGMEKISGLNLQRVRVHYNSRKPAQVQAHAYAQGEDIYLAPGQESHLPHELGHVVQQALDMVTPNTVVNGVAVNDDPELEQHATDLGEAALALGGGSLPRLI